MALPPKTRRDEKLVDNEILALQINARGQESDLRPILARYIVMCVNCAAVANVQALTEVSSPCERL